MLDTTEQTQRFYSNSQVGLTSDQVKSRFDNELYNKDVSIKSKSEKQILKEHTFTFFNIMNFIFAILIITVGFFTNVELIDIGKNILFMGVIFSNIIIGTFQEIRSKRIIDKLSLLTQQKVTVIRDSKKQKISVNDIVLDDVIYLNSGNQIPTDSIILDGEIEVNESLLTGESDPINKKQGDEILSGSFVVSGACHARVEHISEENYAQKITSGAKYTKKKNSQILNTLSKIVQVVGFSIIPVGLLLFAKQYFITGDDLYKSTTNVVAALIGMIPEGLVLLTSVVFAVTVIRLAFHKALVQELYCTENLARVDVLCLDKTGTLTEGVMQVEEIIPFENFSEKDIKEALANLCANLQDENPTFNAVSMLSKEYSGSTQTAEKIIAFSSQRKWSGANFKDYSLVMGATEFILGEKWRKIRDLATKYSLEGNRVLLVAKSSEKIVLKTLSENIEPIGLVLISDKIRKEAPATLKYFKEQGVDIKIISGDNAVTVSKIASKAGLENADKYIDASTLKTDAETKKAVLENSVFGRVTPEQKLQFVKILKENKHIVAMTGDGVNDVLALKECDCSIAMASGSDAARTVSNLVLTDSNFASIPLAFKEGRRAINNLQRSASLFLAKTIYSILMSIFFVFFTVSYPFEPIQMTLISTIMIGIPSFMLALETNKKRVEGTFFVNIIDKALPTGLSVFIGIMLLSISTLIFDLSYVEFSTVAVVFTMITSGMLLVRLSFPFTAYRLALTILLFAGFAVCIIYFKDLFSLTTSMTPTMLIILAALTALSLILTIIFRKLLHKGNLEKHMFNIGHKLGISKKRRH